MDKKLTTLNIGNTDIWRQADKKKLRILAIADGEINCSYNDALKEVNEYEKIVTQISDGYLFAAAAKCLLANHFNHEKVM